MTPILEADFSQLNQFLDQLHPSTIYILCDENTHEFCVPTVLAHLETEVPIEIIEIEPGEELKTIETAAQLWEILCEYEADRNALLINIGGGVMTDMGGFVASTYKRGIRFINIPTTVLAMCDASIGGKTGIDLNFYKNMVGTFAKAEALFVYPEFLQTLPFEELRSGFAEMLKHGLIADKNHWENLASIEEISAENIAPFMRDSMEIKTRIVEQDFREEHIRKTLNFGHTIGHALESLFIKSDKPILHGEAVAMGMICEIRLAVLEGILEEIEAEKCISTLRRFYPHIDISEFSNAALLQLMLNDKKNTSGKISFSLIEKIGSCRYNQHCSEKNIAEALDYYRALL